MRKIQSFVVLSLVTLSVTAFCDVASDKLDLAKGLFAQRADASKLALCLSTLTDAQAATTDNDVKYDIMMLQSAALYFQGVYATNDSSTKVKIFSQAMTIDKTAIALNGDWADAYYWLGANMARWAEANGVIASLSHKTELIADLNKLQEPDRLTKDGQPALPFEAYGANRILGRVYFKLPGFAGGSRTKSLQFLSEAYNNAPKNALNVSYYAETLYSGGSSAEQAKAKQILDTMLANDPKTFDPDRVPENTQDFSDARKLRAQMGR